MDRTTLTVPAAGGTLGGWVRESDPADPPVLLLHGGPGLGYEYLDGLADEIGAGYRVAAFQQRGLAPSVDAGAFTIDEAVADVVAVLDALEWDRAWVLGHSWGGHLVLHLLAGAPERTLGAVVLDGLGATGDGGEAAFEAELLGRTPEADRRRAHELDQRALRGEGTSEDIEESVALLWPAYFADREHVMPMPAFRSSIPAYSGLWESLKSELASLEQALGTIAVPVSVVAGGGSPMPQQVARDTAAAIPGSTLAIVEGAGHFPWFERPGCVREALAALVGSA